MSLQLHQRLPSVLEHFATVRRSHTLMAYGVNLCCCLQQWMYDNETSCIRCTWRHCIQFYNVLLWFNKTIPDIFGWTLAKIVCFVFYFLDGEASAPKSDGLLLWDVHSSKNLIKIYRQVFELSCWQTNKHTKRTSSAASRPSHLH